MHAQVRDFFERQCDMMAIPQATGQTALASVLALLISSCVNLSKLFSLCLCFLIFKVKIIIVSSSEGGCKD